jgi:hypothetical protein
MSITLLINGSLGLTFLNKEDRSEVLDSTQFEQGLKDGSLVIALASRQVHRLGDFKVVAYFDFEVYDDTEYEFEID